MLKTFIDWLCSLCLFSLCSQAFSLFCPNNFNSINLGDSIAAVLQTCGHPSSQSSHARSEYTAEKWTYYVKQGSNQGTSVLQITFSNNQVINITLTGNHKECSPLPPHNSYTSSQNESTKCVPVMQQQTHSLSHTDVCGGLISLEESLQTVQYVCGQPVFISHEGSPSMQKNITIFVYTGPPVTKLIFEDGVLTNRVQGE